jgi:hypothetical protein
MLAIKIDKRSWELGYEDGLRGRAQHSTRIVGHAEESRNVVLLELDSYAPKANRRPTGEKMQPNAGRLHRSRRVSVTSYPGTGNL